LRVLVDTSVWSLALRKQGPADHPAVEKLTQLLRNGEDVFFHTPATVTPVPVGMPQIGVRKCGCDGSAASVVVRAGMEAKLDLRLAPKTAAKAAVRSVLLPGLGQQYKGQRGKAWLVRAVAVGGAAVAYTGIKQRKTAIDDYDAAKAEYDAAVSGEQIDHWYGEMDSRYGKIGKAENLRNAGFGLLGGIWVLNIVDAVFGFPIRCPDDRADLGRSLRLDPSVAVGPTGDARVGVRFDGVVR
jgi:hypothetical protein